MKQVLQRSVRQRDPGDDYANLALPDGYRGVTVHKDEVRMFDGFDSATRIRDGACMSTRFPFQSSDRVRRWSR